MILPIVARDELAAGHLQLAADLPGISESFVAVTLQRRFGNPLLAAVLPPPNGRETANAR